MDSPNNSKNNSAPGRWRVFAGAAAATVVVGLLAALLAHNATQRGTGATATSTSIPSTPGPIGTPGSSQPANFQPGEFPVVAPSDPQIVYRVVKNVPQRSTDGGKTYRALPRPTTDITPIDDVWVTVSPLDPTRVFLTISGQKDGQGCLPPTPPNGSLASRGASPFIGVTLLSGYTDCSEQFYSANSGQTWTQLRLPGGIVMGGTNLFRMAQGPFQSSAYVFQAQGTRLYAGAGFASQGGSILASYGARLLASDDGGATWKLLDQPIISAGQIACDFAASPTGSTLFAAVTNQSCGNEGMPAMSLWRSDNGGQSWSQVSALPSPVEGGMAVAASGALYIFEPAAQAQSHSVSITMTSQYALVSLNKGVSFSSAPSAGTPTGATLVGPFGVLSDSSVIYQVQAGATQGGLYAWKAGAASWTKLVAAPSGTFGAVIVTRGPNEGDTLTITDSTGAIVIVPVSG